MEFTTAKNLHALSAENRDTAAHGLGGPCSHSAHSLRISSALTLRYRAKPTAPSTPSLTSCSPLCLLVTILSSRPRGTLEGTEVENRSGKGAVLPFRWTGINGGEAHPEKSKLGGYGSAWLGPTPQRRSWAGGVWRSQSVAGVLAGWEPRGLKPSHPSTPSSALLSLRGAYRPELRGRV